MSLASPRPCSAYRLPSNKMERAADWIVSKIERHWSALAAIAIAAIVVGVQTMDGNEQIRAEQVRAAKIAAERDAIADWHRHHNVRLSLEGSPAQVANMALQAAAAVQP